MGKKGGSSWLTAVRRAFRSPSKDKEKPSRQREEHEQEEEEKVIRTHVSLIFAILSFIHQISWLPFRAETGKAAMVVSQEHPEPRPDAAAAAASEGACTSGGGCSDSDGRAEARYCTGSGDCRHSGGCGRDGAGGGRGREADAAKSWLA